MVVARVGVLVMKNKMTQRECKCQDWQENIPILSSTLTMQVVRGYSKGLKKSFSYCPYCSNKLTEVKEE